MATATVAKAITAAVTSHFEEDCGSMDPGLGGGQQQYVVTRRGNLKSQGSQTSGTQIKTISGERVRVTFVETEDKPAVRKPSYPPPQEPVSQKYNVKKKEESKFKAATRKLQRFLFKPFDYDANLS